MWSPCGDVEEVKVVTRAAASAQPHFATPRSELSAWAHAAQQLQVCEDDVSCPHLPQRLTAHCRDSMRSSECTVQFHKVATHERLWGQVSNSQKYSDECPSAPHKERLESNLTQAGDRESKIVEETKRSPEARKSRLDEVVCIAVNPGRRGHFGWIDTTAKKESSRSQSNACDRRRSPTSRGPLGRSPTTTRDAVEVEIPRM